MSLRKDRERAKQFIYRDGQRISRAAWDKYQKELREVAEEQRLKALGLVRSKPRVLVAQRVGLEKAEKQIMTPTELMNKRED